MNEEFTIDEKFRELNRMFCAMMEVCCLATLPPLRMFDEE
jgi:hypothetical protein